MANPGKYTNKKHSVSSRNSRPSKGDREINNYVPRWKFYNRKMNIWQRKTEVLPGSHWESSGKFGMWRWRYHISHCIHRSDIWDRCMPWDENLRESITGSHWSQGINEMSLEDYTRKKKKIVKSHEWNIGE